MGGQWERVNSLSFSCEEMKILDIENYNDNIKDLSKKTLRKKSCRLQIVMYYLALLYYKNKLKNK